MAFMRVIAQSTSVHVSPRKVRLVADAIVHLPLEEALELLASADKRAALPLTKTIKSAIANAVHNEKLDRSLLFFRAIEVTEGPALKRYHPSTRGRIHPYKKKTSHIRVILDTKEERRAHGAKS